MNKKLSIVAMLSLGLLAFSSCKKDKEDEKKADTAAKVTNDKGGEKPTEVKPETDKKPEASPVAAADVKGLWKHIPADTEIVISVNLGGLTGSALWKQYGPMAIAEKAKELDMVKEKCGFDPLTAIKSIHLGMNSDDNDKPVIIVSGIERATAQKCLTALAAEDGKTIEITEDGPISFVKAEKKTTGMGWINDTTVVIIPESTDKEVLLARIAGTGGVNTNAALMGAIGKAKSSAPLWFAAKLKDGSKASTNAKGMTDGKGVTGVYGAVGFANGIELNIGAEFANAEDATALKAKISGVLPMAKGMLGAAAPIADKVKIGVSGNDLTVDVALTAEEIETLKNAAAPMMGGM